MAGNAADTAMGYALAQVGKPYIWGGTGPKGYDCSGLTMMSYKAAGISMPHFTGLQINVGYEVPRSQLAPGDLVFPDAGHVQLYLGGGKVVEAAHTGTNIRVVPMWGFSRARRPSTPGSDHSSGGGSGTQAGGLLGPLGDILGPGSAGNPLGDIGQIGSDVKGIYNVFVGVEKLTAYLSNPANWLSIGEFMVGVTLMLIAVIHADHAKAAVSTITKAATKVANT